MAETPKKSKTEKAHSLIKTGNKLTQKGIEKLKPVHKHTTRVMIVNLIIFIITASICTYFIVSTIQETSAQTTPELLIDTVTK